MKPYSFFHQYQSDNSLYSISELDEKENPQNGQECKFCQRISEDYADAPDEYAVKKEGDYCFTAGTERKVQAVQQGMLRYKYCRDHDQPCGKMFDLFRRFIKFREERSRGKHQDREKGTEKDGKYDDFCIGFFGALHVTGSQYLPHDNSDGFSHGNKGNLEEVADRIGDVECRYNMKVRAP